MDININRVKEILDDEDFNFESVMLNNMLTDNSNEIGIMDQDLSNQDRGMIESFIRKVLNKYNFEGKKSPIDMLRGIIPSGMYDGYDGDEPAFKIPDSISEIRSNNFINCTCKKILVSGGLESINENTFSNCPNLEAVSIVSPNLKVIGKGSFCNCPKLATVQIYSHNEIKVANGTFENVPDNIKIVCSTHSAGLGYDDRNSNLAKLFTSNKDGGNLYRSNKF